MLPKPYSDYTVLFRGNEFHLLNDSGYELGRAESGGTVKNGPVSLTLSFSVPAEDDSVRLRIKDMDFVLEEIEEETGEKVIGVIPFVKKRKLSQSRDDKPVKYMDHNSSAAEAFKMLATAVEFEEFYNGMRSVEVSSSSQGEGKSTAAVNLAIAAANFGHNTILVDADTKKGIQHEMFGFDRKPGFSEIINGSVKLSESIRECGIPKLHIISSGHMIPQKDQVLAVNAVAEFMGQMHKQYDFIVVDSPPVLLVDDSIRIGKYCGGIIYTVGLGIISRPVVMRGLERFRKHSCRIIGICVNDIKKKEKYYIARDAYLERLYSPSGAHMPMETGSEREKWRIFTG